MKPYGREKKVNGSSHKYGSHWKKDYHVHDRNHRKVESWWEEICDYLSRTSIKGLVKKQIDDEISE